MATSWQEAFDLGDGAVIDSGVTGSDDKSGRLRRLRERMRASRQALTAELTASVVDRLDDADWERLEEALILADVGARTTAEVVQRLEHAVDSGELADAGAVRERLVGLLAEVAEVGEPRIVLRDKPAVIIVVGVNGTGKTTTVGKLAAILQGELGQKVIVAAADTYRAAAIEQLETWADHAGVDVVRGAPGGDPGSVVFDAIAAAEARGADVVIADTAGRLHTHPGLMEELAKVSRVVAKRLEGAPHETLIVVDATTGQNGLRQAQIFAEAVDLTGVVLTKLDGTAKGGIALAIASEMKLPVKLIGVGETLEDLRPFDAREFAAALVGE